MQPIISCIHRHHGVEPTLQKPVFAPVPAGMTTGSPFAADIAAFVLHSRIKQAVGFMRLACPINEVFNLIVIEGAVDEHGSQTGAATFGEPTNRFCVPMLTKVHVAATSAIALRWLDWRSALNKP